MKTMFRKIHIIAIVLLATLSVAQTNLVIETIDGAQYHDVKVRKITNRQVTFRHGHGVCTLNLSELTDLCKKDLGITEKSTVSNMVEEDIAVIVGTAPPRPAVTPQAVCPRCHGARIITCPTCQGRQFGLDKQADVTCELCSGEGYKYKRVITKEHKYNSRDVFREYTTVRDPCNKCSGTGKTKTTQRTYCEKCGGIGTIPCQVCNK